MNEEILYKKLTGVFQEALEDETLVLTSDLTANDVPNWDSLNHIRLIVSIEEAFGIKFSTLEVTEFKNVGDLVDLILSKQGHLVD